MIYAVIDTNVNVSSLKSAHPDSATVRAMDAVYCGKVKIIVNDAILAEYDDVLHRERLQLDAERCDFILSLISDIGMRIDPVPTDAEMPDADKRVFFEVTLAGLDIGDAHLVTGNMKHYPMASFVVTPAQFCEIAGL